MRTGTGPGAGMREMEANMAEDPENEPKPEEPRTKMKESSIGAKRNGGGGTNSKTGKNRLKKSRGKSDSSQPGIRAYLNEIKTCNKGNSQGNRPIPIKASCQ